MYQELLIDCTDEIINENFEVNPEQVFFTLVANSDTTRDVQASIALPPYDIDPIPNAKLDYVCVLVRSSVDPELNVTVQVFYKDNLIFSKTV